jgi:subtilisin family serine protease
MARVVCAVVAGAVGTLFAAAPAHGQPPDRLRTTSGGVPTTTEHSERQRALVVGLRSEESAAFWTRHLSDHAMSVRRIPRLQALVLDGEEPAGAVRRLRDDPRVAYIEPLRSRHLHAEPADAVDPVTGRPHSWALHAVRAREGLASAASPGVPVGVVDTGVDVTHPDLTGRLRAGHDVLGAGSVADVTGHGTFVAGLIGAVDGNGAGGWGLAGATPIIPVRVSTGAPISSAQLAAGIVAAVDAGARVINLSLGGPGYAEVERVAIDYALSHDVLLVASAGNSGLEGNAIHYPAAALGGDQGGWGDGLSVAATDPLGQHAPFSSYNRHVSIAAPGAGAGGCDDGVYSTIPAGPALLWPGTGCGTLFENGIHGPGRYAYGQGTSFSAPLAAGAAALVRAVTPALRADQTGDVLRRSANPGPAGGGWNPRTGAGLLDVAAAVMLARRYDLTPPELSVAVHEGPGAVRIRASGTDRTEPGRELAGIDQISLSYSPDGATYWPLSSTASSFDRSFVATPRQPLWLGVHACDQNRNCDKRTLGPFRGEGESTTPAARSSARPRPAKRLRATVLGFGIPPRCVRAASTCVRLAWKVRTPPRARAPYRYTLVVREQGRSTPLLRATGTGRSGLKDVLELRLRRPPACPGRIVARITFRSGGRTVRTTRRAAVPGRCAPEL